MFHLMRTLIVRVLLGLLDVYRFFSRMFPSNCRFYPTCSRYMSQSLETHGLVKGLWLGTKRLCRCHPLNPGGIDPVPGMSEPLSSI